MKIRTIIFLAISAVVLFSFTFVSVTHSESKAVKENSESQITEPVGGFVSEDKF